MNYYDLLGVSKDSSEDDIKDAFKKLALQYHPDKLRHLPKDEKERKQEKMYEINEAFRVLSNSTRRNEYDLKELQKEEETHNQYHEGQSRPTRSQRGGTYEGLFTNIFTDSGLFGGGMFNNNSSDDFFGSRPKVDEGVFTIPENDWGLLLALKKAYESKGDGKWSVRRDEGDKRDWLPKELYRISKEEGEVFVYRKIMDWRDKSDQQKTIKTKEEGKYEYTKEIKSDSFLSEYYLCGKGRHLLEESYKIPTNLRRYLSSLKELAYKFANKATTPDGNYDLGKAYSEINFYGRVGSKNTRIEGQSLWSDDENREWVKQVPLKDFWKRLSQAEQNVIQTEGIIANKEGQSNIYKYDPGENKA